MRVTGRLRYVALTGLTGAALLGVVQADGSSHREAPLISEDPVADTTDVYAFVSPDRPDSVTIIANWIPLEEPASGPNFWKFGDDVLYTLKIDNDGDAYEDVTYEFRFKTEIVNPDTFLYNTGPITSLDDPDWNIRQTYSVWRVEDGHRERLGSNLVSPPVNIGPRSTPNYESLASQAYYDLDGTRVFAGQRDDPFFVDLGSVFDLLGLRPLNDFHIINPPNAEPGKDEVSGYNTHTIAIQVPTSDLTDGDDVIGVWSSTYRRAIEVRNRSNTRIATRGPWVSVSRLANPLVNEVVIPLADKDRFNGSEPNDDAQFLQYVQDPMVAGLIPVLYADAGIAVPAAPRDDLVAVFLTGVPGLNQPANVTPSEQIRLNTAILPDNPGCATPSPLGVIGGDICGFPNGRRLGDDVTDIELRALAGVLQPAFNVFPNNALTDGVDANDFEFMDSFPYVATPEDGYEHAD